MDLDPLDIAEPERFEGGEHPLLAPDQDRRAIARVAEGDRGADHLLLFPFGEDDAGRIGAHPFHDRIERVHGGIEPRRELTRVAAEIVDRPARHARIHRRLGHRGRDARNEPGVEGVGDDVIGTETKLAPRRGVMHLIGDVLAGELGQRLGRGDLHRLVDGARPHVEGAAENVRKAEHVVDLVRIVGAASGDDRVRCYLARLLRGDFGIRIGHREDDRARGHRAHHLRGERPFDGKPEEDVRPFQRLGQRARPGRHRMRRLPLVHPLGAALIDHPLGVAEDDVGGAKSHRLDQFGAGDRRRSCPVDDELDIGEIAAGEVAGIDQPGGGDDRRAMLVVMEDGDVHQLAQPLLDDEALRRLDVLEIDAAEARGKEADRIDELIDILGRHFEVDAVDVGEALEEGDLALHHRLGGERPEIAEPEHRGAVRDHRDHVAAGGVVIGMIRIAGDVQAGLGDPGRVGEAQIARRGKRLGDADLELAGPSLRMQAERLFRRDPCRARILALGHRLLPISRTSIARLALRTEDGRDEDGRDEDGRDEEAPLARRGRRRAEGVLRAGEAWG